MAAIIGETRRYLHDFADVTARARSARDIVDAMSERYPEHGNLTTLIASATAATRREPT